MILSSFKLFHHGARDIHAFFSPTDWWSISAHKAVLTQLTKLRMNFIGFHTCLSTFCVIHCLISSHPLARS